MIIIDQVAGRALITRVVAVALVVSGARFVRVNASCLEFGDPTIAPEPEAVAFVRANGITGRVLTYYNYGEYAIWHLAPDVKVSMDGRRETVYSDAAVAAHSSFYADPTSQATYPDSIDAEFVWLPNVFRAGTALESHGWHPVFGGEVSTVWTRTPLPTSRASAPPQPRGRRCFPGL